MFARKDIANVYFVLGTIISQSHFNIPYCLGEGTLAIDNSDNAANGEIFDKYNSG